MPQRPFDELPDDARCWVFAVDRPLAPAAESQLLALTDEYLAEWRAHGTPLASGRDWRDAHFLAVAVDERAAGASGCSVDALFRTFKGSESLLGATFASGATVFWRNGDGTVQQGSRAEFAAHVRDGVITDATPVFDPTVTTAGAWRRHFERPMAASWHARLVAPASRTA
ncbi:MAG: hypothetical protein MUF00_06775 [Gemmatimonadaceae bacterium]|jgi:hypothetical protein|nr:hypothetical protein [Gemmatimonadaceae bacterium]